jgi:RecB family exonuclease
VGSLLEVLATVCREAPLREKIVVAPSLAIGHQIGDALARAGTPWVNLRFETTRTIADSIAAFAMAREGVLVLSRAQALAILERACDDVLDADSYFVALRGRPGLYRAIQRSIDELRHAGVRTLPSSAFEDPRKASDLARILDRYEEELSARGFVDRYGVLARAIALVREGSTLPWDSDTQWITPDDLELSPAERELLDLVAPRRHVVERPRAPVLREVHFVRAAGEENEIRHALRRMRSVDDAEILYTQRDAYLALAYELTSELEIPTTFAEGISVAYTRPGQALLGFLHWLADDFAATHLQNIARAGVIRTGSESLSPFQLGRVLRKALIGWGRDRYETRISALLTRLEALRKETDSESRIAAITREIGRTEEARIILRRLLQVTDPVGDDAEIDATLLAQVALSFLDTFASTSTPIDGMALAALRRMLNELTRLPEARATRGVVLGRLAEAVREVHVSASNPRPGHLHVAPIRGGGWSGRRSLFVVGLDDEKHPGSGLQDPIVLDAERLALNDAIAPRALDLRGDAPARASAQLEALLARAPDAQWTLSWSELDLRDRRSGFPARDVLAIARSMHPATSFAQLIEDATPAGFLDKTVPLTIGEWALAQRLVYGARLDSVPTARELARESDALTEFDGRIPIAPNELDPRTTERIYSASQLEKMARCPFGWFLERVLRIEPVEDLERLQERWLDNRQFGVLVHKVLERTMQAIRESQSAVSHEAHCEQMQAIAEEELAHWRDEVPVPTANAYAQQRDELLATCDIFLRTEERHATRIVPRMFELPFGKDGDFAIALGDGRSVKLRGSIDRVDQDRLTGHWEVWDYKTGSLYEYRDAWQLKQGTKLQHAIYARALEHVLRAQGLEGDVQCSGYYFPTPKGNGERAARTCEPGGLEEALTHLFDVVGSGFFPQPREGKCAFCPYPSICGDPAEVSARMVRKQDANADDAGVRAWRSLQEIE